MFTICKTIQEGAGGASSSPSQNIVRIRQLVAWSTSGEQTACPYFAASRLGALRPAYCSSPTAMEPWLSTWPATACRTAIVTSVAFIPAACSGPSAPVAPSVVERPASDVSLGHSTQLTGTKVANTYPLVNGSFTLTLRAEDGRDGTVTGTYTGEATVSEHGMSTATLELQVTATSGIGSTITAIEASGTRAFVSEGDFALALRLTSSLTKSPLRVTFKGTSQLSCSTSHRVLVAMHGTDAPRGGFLEIAMDLQHEVEQTGCSSP